MRYVCVHEVDCNVINDYEFRIGVVGSRSIAKSKSKQTLAREIIKEKLTEILEEICFKKVALISGGAEGLDKLAEEVAEEMNLRLFHKSLIGTSPNL